MRLIKEPLWDAVIGIPTATAIFSGLSPKGEAIAAITGAALALVIDGAFLPLRRQDGEKE